MTKKNKPLKFKNITEGNIYIVKRHGYAGLYRLHEEDLQFYNYEKGKWLWTPTIVDQENTKFSPISIEEMMVILLENKTLDDKKK